jgi:subtilisin family serine protease
MPLRVLDVDGTGNVWVLAEALQYAMAHGATVVNMSLAMPSDSRLLGDVLKAVACGDPATIGPTDLPCYRPDGAVVVEAAGNFGSQTQVFPAADTVKGALSVGASEPNDSLAPFSNFGSWVSVAAPGDMLVSAVPGGGTGVWAGTSMAAPLVAGEAALVRAVSPGVTTLAITTRIKQSSAVVNGPVRYRVDALAALMD